MILTGCMIAEAQEVSTEVIPSEEELLDALQSGEIDYDTYVLLLDLLLNGDDSLHIDLYDLLPSTANAREAQIHDFVKAASYGRARKSFAKYQFAGELQDSGRTKYRLSGRYSFNSNWSGEIGLAGEYSGRERFIRRSIAYTAHRAKYDTRVTVGNYRARFGLGTIIGYRGKLVGSSDNIDGESLLFPDFGGYNGGLFELYVNRFHLNALGSVQRDSAHSVSTFATCLKTTSVATEAGVVVAANVVRNRTTERQAEVYQIGGYLRQHGRNSSIAGEYSIQGGEAEAGALVLEAKKRWSPVDLSFSGWSYGKNFFGLSAGSKAASLSRTVEIDDVQLEFSDKRSGQTGGRLQSSVRLAEKWSVSGDALFGARGDDTSTLQGLVGTTYLATKRHQITSDFLYKSIEKVATNENIKRRGRVEWRGDWSGVRTRAAIGFSDETTYGEYWSLLVQCHIGKQEGERWQIWSNWRRVAHGRIDAWHGFVSVTEDLARSVRGSVKFTDSYSHTSTPRHSPTIGLELQVQL